MTPLYVPLYVPKLVAMQLRAGREYRQLLHFDLGTDDKAIDQRAQDAVEGRK